MSAAILSDRQYAFRMAVSDVLERYRKRHKFNAVDEIVDLARNWPAGHPSDRPDVGRAPVVSK